MICNNKKCNKEFEKGGWIWSFESNEIRFCSDGCYMFGRATLEHSTLKSFREYIISLHPRWQGAIKPFLDEIDLKMLEAETIEDKMNKVKKMIYEAADKACKEFLEKLV